jgi:hypothetical protein
MMKIKVGNLVEMRPSIANPTFYGLGLVVKVEGEKCFIRWSVPQPRPLGECRAYALEVVS